MINVWKSVLCGVLVLFGVSYASAKGKGGKFRITRFRGGTAWNNSCVRVCPRIEPRWTGEKVKHRNLAQLECEAVQVPCATQDIHKGAWIPKVVLTISKWRNGVCADQLAKLMEVGGVFWRDEFWTYWTSCMSCCIWLCSLHMYMLYPKSVNCTFLTSLMRISKLERIV